MAIRRPGYSLLELLICMAIISILMALYMPVLAKAKRKAEEVASRESLRQGYIGRLADNANIARPGREAPPTREACRAAFRKSISDGSGPGEMLVTEMLYNVRNEAEFRAYWHTLIDPSATGGLQFDGAGNLIAEDEEGNRFTLTASPEGPVVWEFFSTNLAETSSGTLGMTVLYSDVHVEHLVYPGDYPCCATVAELSHRFVVESL